MGAFGARARFGILGTLTGGTYPLRPVVQGAAWPRAEEPERPVHQHRLVAPLPWSRCSRRRALELSVDERPRM